MFNLVLETLSASALPAKFGWAMAGIAELTDAMRSDWLACSADSAAMTGL